MKSVILKMVLLGIISFLAQTLIGLPLDLMFLVTVLAALCWGVRGGLIAGALSGLLIGGVASFPLLTVVFFYAVIGYVSALVLETAYRGTLTQDLFRAAAITGIYLLTENSLFIEQGIARVDLWNVASAPFHLVALFIMFRLSRHCSVDDSDIRKHGSVGLIRSIVR